MSDDLKLHAVPLCSYRRAAWGKDLLALEISSLQIESGPRASVPKDSMEVFMPDSSLLLSKLRSVHLKASSGWLSCGAPRGATPPRPSFRRVLLSASLWALAVSSGCASQPANLCEGQRASLLVHTHSRRLALCRRGRVVASYRVALGRGGVPKRRPGDRKTPLGRYLIGQPRRSHSGFHRFIPIYVPRKVGSAVGIHGPPRRFRWLGSASTWVNWTQGCVALGSDAELDQVVQFVHRYGVRRVELRGDKMRMKGG